MNQLNLKKYRNLTAQQSNKVINFQRRHLELFKKLDTGGSLIHESAFYNYTRYVDESLYKECDINDWYKDYYHDTDLLDRGLTLEVFQENGFEIDSTQFLDFYAQKVISIVDFMPKQAISVHRIKEKHLLDYIKNSELNASSFRMIFVEMGLNDPTKMSLLKSCLTESEIKNSIIDGIISLSDLKSCLEISTNLFNAKAYLKNECGFCLVEFPLNKMCEFCKHSACRTCFIKMMIELIENKLPANWFCPLCPENDKKIIDINFITEYIKEECKIAAKQNSKDYSKSLDKMLRLMDTKLFDECTRKSRNFCNCPNELCTYGFFYDDGTTVICKSCKKKVCVECNVVWSKDHDNRSCVEYQAYMRQQPISLVCSIIKCPKCSKIYDKALGGCLHYQCKSCQVEFCGACYSIYSKKKCNEGCDYTFFHTHHPRNCLYNLRDYKINQLQKMLSNKSYVKLKTSNNKCDLIITDEKLHNKKCNNPAYENSGRCEEHYKEYLIELILKYKIDPIDFIDDIEKLNIIYKCEQFLFLEKKSNENDADFLKRLKKAIKDKCKLFVPTV